MSFFGDEPDKPRFTFLSVAEMVRCDARRHRSNAVKYVAAGLHDCASGSLRKADKFEARAREIERRFPSR